MGSEFGVAGGAGEGDDVADVLHAGGELDGALEAEAEAGVGGGAVAAQVQVPPVGGVVQAGLGHAALEDMSRRSSRWLPPMISPMRGTSTSMARTVSPGSPGPGELRRM